MDHDALSARLLAAVTARAGEESADWLAAAARRRELDPCGVFAAVSRRVGRAPLTLTAAEAESLAQAGLGWPTRDWSVDDAARAGLLLLAAARFAAPRLAIVFENLCRLGGLRERAALMRTLPLLPQASRFCAWARAAARSETRPLFMAVACDNPYPARHFPEESLRQLSLKAEAWGIPPRRLLGVERRRALGLEALLASGGAA